MVDRKEISFDLNAGSVIIPRAEIVKLAEEKSHDIVVELGAA